MVVLHVFHDSERDDRGGWFENGNAFQSEVIIEQTQTPLILTHPLDYFILGISNSPANKDPHLIKT